MRGIHRVFRWPSSLPVWLVLLAIWGCGPASESTPPDAPPGASTVSTPAQASPAAAKRASQPIAPPEGGIWYISSMGGARVGYERNAVTPFTQGGTVLVRVESLSHMTVRRFGEPIDMDVEFSSIETPQSRLLEFEGTISQGPTPIKMRGRVVGEELQIKTTTKGVTQTSSIPWSDDYGGLGAIQHSLSADPMEPGEQRTILALFPGFNVLATNELVARQWETVELLTNTQELLRIDTSVTVPGAAPIEGATWTDRDGAVMKSRINALDIESVRATRAEALEEVKPAQFDLVRDVKVRVARPLSSPHETRRVRYQVELDGGDPAKVFVSAAGQRVGSREANVAEVTVYAIRPDGDAGNPDAPADPPTDDDLKPNNLIQSDYPAIVARAGQVAGEEQDPWQVAVALERCVDEVITRSGYSQAFATAAEVIDSGEGDCTEHAVLLAAMARARGIPARTAIGLVYVDQAFWYHMWTEVHVAGRWTPLDATRPHGGTSAAYLKMGHDSLEGASALSSFLPVLEVIGRLKIEILEVE